MGKIDEMPDLPPEIPPAEMSEQGLCALVAEGNILGVESALRAHNVRLPAVIRQLARVLEQEKGNLATVLVTMLISRFHIAQATTLAHKVLAQSASAGTEELVDLTAALFQQERLETARKVVNTALQQNNRHPRALYFLALLQARRGDIQAAFSSISKSNPKFLGAHGLAVQARYAAWCRNEKAFKGALKLGEKAAKNTNNDDSTDEDVQVQLQTASSLVTRMQAVSPDAPPADLRTAFLIEYGSLLIEQSTTANAHGGFDAETISYADVGRLIQRIRYVMAQIGPEVKELLYANEDGEVVAAGLSQLIKRPYRAWNKDLNAKDGDWLCMGTAASHPHLSNDAVQSLDRALKQGTLRSLCLVLPRGWRCPVVPDLIGRVTKDDEFPWARDDEIEDIYEQILEGSPSDGLVREEHEGVLTIASDFAHLLRSSHNLAPLGHVPYRDETPLDGGR